MTAIHPSQRPDVEAWLDQIGAVATFNPDLPITKINEAASLANQVRHEPLNHEVVERYVAALNSGAVFPAILLDAETMAILGGVHRWASAQNAGHSTIAAYLVTAKPDVLLRIRVEDNARHGMPTTTAERVEHAVALMATGMAQRDAAQIVGIPQPKLSIAVAAQETTVRAEELGLDDRIARLPQPARYQLSQLDDDDVFTAAATLAAVHRVPSAAVAQIVREVRSVATHEALRLIGAETTEWAEREAGTVRQRGRTARAEFEGALATIIASDPQAVFDACPNDDVRAVLAQRIMNAAGVLQPTHALLAGPKAKGRAA